MITENDRVAAAARLASGEMTVLGALMVQQVAGGDYEVSSDVLDRLVAATRSAGALGARLTGAGLVAALSACCR